MIAIINSRRVNRANSLFCGVVATSACPADKKALKTRLWGFYG